MAIVTLSRELGSRGTEIAEALAARLGCSLLDKESLESLLRSLGMPGAEFERDDEKRPGFWEQLTLQRIRYLDFMKAAMYRFAGDKDCVVVGRGAHIVFRGVPGTLRVRVVAPFKARVTRVRERFGFDEPHAARLIRQSDHDRAGYHKYFFNTHWDSSSEYDLVVNTADITPAEACDMIAALLRTPAYADVGALSRDVLRDLRTAQDVIIAIAYRERVPVMNLDVVCDKGVVAIDGTARSQALIDRCQEVARRVEGVTRVVSTMIVVDFGYYPGS
jgi:cytidylate kinase